jgi:tRNA G18 (ribose-2'-O)-methylase SpoU
MDDTRNVIDSFKGKSIEAIKSELDKEAHILEIAIENLERDFNMGTIVRNANAFGVRKIHVIGSKQWNKRGAMMTDKYLDIVYHGTIDEFIDSVKDKVLIAIDNVEGSTALASTTLDENAIMIFGSEGPGISDELLRRCDKIVAIEQFGSTRSINVGVAAGIAMYEWLRRHRLL